MDENEKPRRKHSLWMSSAVTVAIITSGSSLLKSYWTKQDSSKDMQDSYKVTAQAVNDLRVSVGRIEGRLEEMERIHSREGWDKKEPKHAAAAATLVVPREIPEPAVEGGSAGIALDRAVPEPIPSSIASSCC